MTKTSTIRILAAIGFLCFGTFFHVQAQSLAQQGTSLEDIVPAGWLHHEATGDLNKDGIADLVVVATPDFQENLKTRDDGYVYNFNQPVLAIYFGTQQGQQRLWKQYGNVIPANESENCSHEVSLEITSRGTLRITIGLFCSAGSYGTSTDTYTYRYQDGDFFLIGMDREEMMRNTGECTTVSENYLAWKRQVTKSNAFDDTAPDNEKWSRLKKSPLEKLGAREL
ncbi:MAG: FG-GAP repeat protein [Muribaculaceae bacterium]|nr:FG-GAP repeat protein [Muribaculaceae bacterium]MBR5674217.1 FG-GAP repeat protein [Muribaculaceae bacterium]